MAALDFPDTPTNGQVYDKWTWNGSVWTLTGTGNAPPTNTAWGLVAINTWTTTQAGIGQVGADIAASVLTFTWPVGRRLNVSWAFVVNVTNIPNHVTDVFYVNGTGVLDQHLYMFGQASYGTVSGSHIVDSTGVSMTVKHFIACGTATGTCSSSPFYKSQISVTDIGPITRAP